MDLNRHACKSGRRLLRWFQEGGDGMGRNKYRPDAGNLCAIPNLGLLTFAIGASRATLGLVITLGMWQGNTSLGRILLILLWIAVVALGVADQRPNCRNMGAAVGNAVVFAGGALCLLALSKSPWAILVGIWLTALLAALAFVHRRQQTQVRQNRRKSARKKG